MLARRRRLIWGAAITVVALVLGRWIALFVTGRLWESRISEAAALIGTRFALLGGALELLGLLVAISWFIGHFVWVTRSVVLQFGELPRPFSKVSERTLYFAAIGLGLLLGVAAGGGTGQWLDAILLRVAGVRFGMTDMLLQADLGVFAADLPVWELLHERALALVVPALIGVVVVSAAGGTLKIVEQRLWLARQARWQIGFLLVGLALLIGWSYALEPFRLAATRSASLGPSEFLLRTTVSEVVVLFSALAAVLTFLWAIRFRVVVALTGWVGLGLAILGGTILVQSRATEVPLTPVELGVLRPLDSTAFGLHLEEGARDSAATLVPSLWDRDVLPRLVSTDSVPVSDAWPGTVQVAGQWRRVWFLVRPALHGEPNVVAVADDQTGPTGGPASLRWGDETFSPGVVPFLTLSRHHAHPGAPAFDLDPAAAGVALSSGLRRLALAWALQFGPILRATPGDRVAWKLDPVQRLGAIAPFADWDRPRVVVVDRDVYWVSDGYLTIDDFPASRTVTWHDREVGYVRPAFVGVVRARGGEARIYLRADADSLAAAWRRIADPLVEPANNLPPAIADRLGAPPLATSIQSLVAQGAGWFGRPVARIGRQWYPTEQLPNVGSAIDPFRIPFLSEDGQRVGALLRAPGPRPGGVVFTDVDSLRSVPAPAELQQRWDKFPFFQQLRDSIRASGSDFVQGVPRYALHGDTVVAYEPNYVLGQNGAGGLVLVNVALGPRMGAGRGYDLAWQNLRGEVAPNPVGTDLSTRLEQAREWLDKADAALKRGDLEEFGRAFAYLRELLRPEPGRHPEAKP